MSIVTSSFDSTIDPENQLIEVVLEALMKLEIPAIVILPSDNVVESIMRLAQLCLLHNAVDSKGRRN